MHQYSKNFKWKGKKYLKSLKLKKQKNIAIFTLLAVIARPCVDRKVNFKPKDF